MTTQQKIEELEKQLAELKAECNKEIELEGGEWHISGDGHVSNNGCSHNSYRIFGADRKSEQLAERASDEMRISNRLRARRDEIEPDWIDEGLGTNAWYILKYKVGYDVSFDKDTRHISKVYMSKQTATQICEELESGRFKL